MIFFYWYLQNYPKKTKWLRILSKNTYVLTKPTRFADKVGNRKLK